MTGMPVDFRYCPSCGTRNAAKEEECVKCGVVFSHFKRMDVVIQAGSEKGINTRSLVIGMAAVLGLLFAVYVIYVQKFMPTGRAKDPGGLALMSARAEILFKHLLEARTEGEIEEINVEIKALQASLSLIPEGRDMEANLILQKNLADMERLSHFPTVVNAAAIESIRERFEMIRKRLGLGAATAP